MEVQDEGKGQLDRIAPQAGDQFVYEYDLGDSWIHDVVVEEVFPAEPRIKHPVCVDGRRACPPEYENLQEVLKEPAHEEHESTLRWLGGPFDPEAFDLKKINRMLRLRWGKEVSSEGS